MARLNGSHYQLMRKKVGLTADDDYTDASVPIPGYAGTAGTLLSDDPALALAWSIMARRSDGSPLTKIKIKVVFRDASNVEVAGTFSATAFSVVQASENEGPANIRPTVEWLGAVVDQPSKKPVILDVANFDKMGLSFTSITAVGATHVYVYVQEWV